MMVPIVEVTDEGFDLRFQVPRCLVPASGGSDLS